MIDVEANKKEFLNILSSAKISRDGLPELIEWLCKSDFFIAPASTRFHGSYEGGLCEHSIQVVQRLINLRDSEKLLIPDDSVVLAGTLHDVCKVNYYKPELRSKKTGRILPNGKPEWTDVRGYAVDEKFVYGHGEKSVFLIERFMKLTIEEALAIRFHMGPYCGESYWNNVGKVFEQCKLAYLLHTADMMSTYLDSAPGVGTSTEFISV